jgi:hypothetical protein
MAPGGFFDFTFDRTSGKEHHVLHDDFYYRTETLIARADKYGLPGHVHGRLGEPPARTVQIRVTARSPRSAGSTFYGSG